MQDWKMTEIKSAGVSVIRRPILVARHDEMTPKQGTNTLMFCIMTLFTRTACCTNMILFTQTASCRTRVAQ